MEENKSVPILCKNDCGFFGSSMFEGYCSSCFKSIKHNSTNMTADTTSKCSSNQNISTVESDTLQEALFKNTVDSISNSLTDMVITSVTEQKACPKKSRSRCFHCKKRVAVICKFF